MLTKTWRVWPETFAIVSSNPSLLPEYYDVHVFAECDPPMSRLTIHVQPGSSLARDFENKSVSDCITFSINGVIVSGRIVKSGRDLSLDSGETIMLVVECSILEVADVLDRCIRSAGPDEPVITPSD